MRFGVGANAIYVTRVQNTYVMMPLLLLLCASATTRFSLRTLLGSYNLHPGSIEIVKIDIQNLITISVYLTTNVVIYLSSGDRWGLE